MERLSHHISQAIYNERWIPVSLARHCPPLSHLFFADDLLLFARAFVKQVRLIKRCLEEFGVASDQRVNYTKSRILFSSSIVSALQHQIYSVVGMALTEDMKSYLGVPFVHGQLRKNIFLSSP